MRFSTALALCAAPLAMAGSRERRAALASPKEGLDKRVEVNVAGSKVNVEAGSVTEIVVIWVNQGGGASTSTLEAAKSAPAPPASAATHTVIVGGAAGLVYSPESVSAAVGDSVLFTFQQNNHTVTQSAFAKPCAKLDGGMDSGFMPNPMNSINPPPQMLMQVTVATPLWFYCRQTTHCGKGMTFSINPTADKTQAMFKQMAVAQNGQGTLAPIQGGTAPPPAAGSAAAAPPPANAPSSNVAAPPPSNAGTPQLVAGTGAPGPNGQCQCSCLCGVAAFPQASVQGIGAYGGMSGSMPLAMLEK